MTTKEYNLSIEELVLSLHIIGQTEAAAALLQTIIGEIAESEIETRLLVAGHSLMARGWLEIEVNADGGRQQLDPELAEAAGMLAASDFSIGLQQAHDGAEKKLMFHFKQGKIIQHDASLGVVQKIRIHNDQISVIDEAMGTYSIDSFTHKPIPETYIQTQLLENLGTYRSWEIERIQAVLEAAGVSPQASRALAEDFQQSGNLTNVMRIEYSEVDGPICNEGFLMLQGGERLWLLRQITEEAGIRFQIIPGSVEAFQAEMKRLMGTAKDTMAAVH